MYGWIVWSCFIGLIIWQHIGTDLNPADQGSRGCEANRLTGECLNGSEWLSDPDKWPVPVMTEPSKESQAEAKKIKETFQAAVESKDSFDTLLVKHPYWKTIWIMAWIARFIHNSKVPKCLQKTGVLTTGETEQEVRWLIRREQEKVQQYRN